MKSLLATLTLTFVLNGSGLTAQTAPKTGSPQVLKKVLTLKMPKTEADEKPGTRGASVAWHPLQKKYYAVFAGNLAYPQAVFNEKGVRVSPDDQTARIDTRGLWYDPVKKLIMGNAYDDNGWFSYELDTKGIVTDYKPVLEGMNQPDVQSVGAYNATAKRVLFLYNSQVFSYDAEGGVTDTVLIHWGRTKAQGAGDFEDADEGNEDYNHTTVVYTGIKGSELGLLNILDGKIELYDIKSGFLTKTLPLPEGHVNPEPSFNFAYTNGTYWLFDMKNREWVGYK